MLGMDEETGKPVTYNGDGSLIAIGPPGTGKTQCLAIPTLLSWNGPAIVLDVNGQNYAATSKWRNDNVGPVYNFAPSDLARSNCFNPLSTVRLDPLFLWDDSRFLADMILVPSVSVDRFWRDRAIDMLTTAVARACLSEDPSTRGMQQVIEVFHGVDWNRFVSDLESFSRIPKLNQIAKSVLNLDNRIRENILLTGLQSLRTWEDEKIIRSTRKSDWQPADLQTGANPTIYISVRPDEINEVISVLRVLIGTHLRTLSSGLRPGYPQPTVIMLDDFPTLLDLQLFQLNMALVRRTR